MRDALGCAKLSYRGSIQSRARLARPSIEIESWWQLDEREHRGTFDHAGEMAFAAQIVGNECRPGAPSPLLIVAGAHLDHSIQHEHDLPRGSVMPTLVQGGRKLDEPHA